MLAQAVAFGFSIGEISCPTKYFPEASSINFRRSVSYGFGVLGTAIRYRLHRWGILPCALFEEKGGRLEGDMPPQGLVISRARAAVKWLTTVRRRSSRHGQNRACTTRSCRGPAISIRPNNRIGVQEPRMSARNRLSERNAVLGIFILPASRTDL